MAEAALIAGVVLAAFGIVTFNWGWYAGRVALRDEQARRRGDE